MLRTPVSLNTFLVIRSETIVVNGNTEQIGISATVFKVLGVKHNRVNYLNQEFNTT